MGKKAKNDLTVYAYGFDAAGFDLPSEKTELRTGVTLSFVPLSSPLSLDRSDGVIVPQGIFEEIRRRPTVFDTYTDVHVNRKLLLEREREVTNLLREGKWVCFLVGGIVDRVRQGFETQSITETDLCKRLLNAFGIRRRIVGGCSCSAAANEFQTYVHEYAIAQTVFEVPYNLQVESSTIVSSGNQCVGLELLNCLFFLPFHTTKKDHDTCASIVSSLTRAVLDYRQKRVAEVPEWVGKFTFHEEERLQTEVESLRNQINKVEGQLRSWRNYKLIMNSSGDILKNTVVTILEDFFSLKVDPIDEGREDAKIIDEQGGVLVLLETKGTKKGVKRDQINQVDSHRERNALPSSTPGVLLINNQMSVSGIQERLNSTVPDEHIKHARNFNVLIIRTVDLLFLMRHLESISDRSKELLRLFNSGGGWLRADQEGYEIIPGGGGDLRDR